jgi:glycosyltransferase involved in cell wall biosynthesis
MYGDPVLPPLVSAIVPTFNSAATIERALRSIAAQTYGAIEVIVADDASRDATVAVAGRWRERPIQIVQLPHNQGPAGARNAALEAARGKYVSFLDADDEWLPDKIAREVDALERQPSASMAVCDAIWLRNGTVVARIFADDQPVAGPDAWKSLLAYSFIATPCVMARREVVDRIGRFDRSLLIAQDQDLWIRLALAGEVAVVDEVLVRLHLAETSHISRNARRESEFLLPMIERHVAAQRSRLSDAEVRSILGRRLTQIGRNAYGGGQKLLGLRLLARAIALGWEPMANFCFPLHAAGPGRYLKDAVRQLLVRTAK